MDYMKDIQEISDEQAVILWQASRLSLSEKYEKAPRNPQCERFRNRYVGKFQRIHRQSQKQEDIQCVGYRGCGIEERHGTPVCGRTARSQTESALRGYGAKPLSLPECDGTHHAHGRAAR